MSEVIANIAELPDYLKCRITGLVQFLNTDWEKLGAYHVYNLALLFIEAKLQHSFYKLCVSLKFNGNINYDMVLQSLEQMNKLKLNSIMLKKNYEIVNVIRNLTIYGLNEPNTVKRSLQADEIRYKAEEIYSKFKSLFPVAKGRTFEDVFEEAIEDFIANTQHLTKLDRTKITIVRQDSISAKRF